MPGIGETLREARIRRRIDMAEVEEATKIRAKYLRALENEEWELLPGPTYVKTFLRTYADHLELDSRRLVDEYKLRYERPRAGEQAPFAGLAPGGSRAARRQRPQRRRRTAAAFGPAAVVLAIAVALVGALYALGKWGQDDRGGAPATTATPTPKAATARHRKASRHRAAAAKPPSHVKLVLVATGDVYVCLVDAHGRRLVDGQTLSAGQRTRRFTARRLLANFGTANVRMRVNGKTYAVAQSANPVGYELRPGRKPRRLPDAQRPSCA
jgi:transcriptional regulator with XRE-family HTH domain